MTVHPSGFPDSQAPSLRYFLSFILLGFFTAFFTLQNAGYSQAQGVSSKANSNASEKASNRILVKFKAEFAGGVKALNAKVPPAAARKIQAALDEAGAKVYKNFNALGITVLERSASSRSIENIIQRLNDSGLVEYAEPDSVMHVDAFPQDPPNDTNFGNQWGLHNTGQSGGTVDADIDAPEAWQTQTGDGNNIVVVIDTGVNYNHEDLAANMWVNTAEAGGTPNIDDDGNGYVDDIHGINAIVANPMTSAAGDPLDDQGHGTNVAGIIGAVTNNGKGVAGVSPNVKIMACKFIEFTGSGTTSDAIECLNYAVMMKTAGEPVIVTNNSYGCLDNPGDPLDGTPDDPCFFEQPLVDAIQSNADSDILFVAGAGNDLTNADEIDFFPATYDLDIILSVAAFDRNDSLSFFSNYGPTTIDLAAPGESIWTTDMNGAYEVVDGTSFAAPFASGAAAVAKAQHLSLDSVQIKNLLMSTVVITNALEPATAAGGRLNLNDALNCVPGSNNMLLKSPANGFNYSLGQQASVAVRLHNCLASINGAIVTASPDNGDPEFTLFDDGISPDVTAGDGIYSATWVPANAGVVNLDIEALIGGIPLFDSVSGNVIASGYSVDDTASYNWINAGPGGTSILAGTDDAAQVIDIGFSFDFFGETHTTINVSSNGFMNFGGGSVFDNPSLPTGPGSPGIIALFWDDLDLFDGRVYHRVDGTAPNRTLTLQWVDVAVNFGLEFPGTFEAILYEGSNNIKFQYADVIFDSLFGTSSANNGAQATVGIESPGATSALQYSYNSPSLSNGMAILFSPSTGAHSLSVPAVGGTPNPVLSEGNASLAVNAFDSDGHILTYSWSASCPGLTGSGSFSDSTIRDPIWTAPLNDTGAQETCVISVHVDDGNGSSQTVQFNQLVDTVFVHSVTIDSGPTGTPNPVATAGAVNLLVTASDNEGHGLNYNWSAVCGGGLGMGSFNDNSLQNPVWTAPANATGVAVDCTITVVVDDGLGESDSANYTQTVSPVHELTIDSGPTPDTNPVASGGVVSLSSSATDTHLHPINYSWSASCGALGNGSFNDNTLQNPVWTAPVNNTGSQATCTVAVTVNDGAGGLSDTNQYFQLVDPEVAACGNGVIDAGEACDDGGESASCDADCSFASCGDGTLNTTAGEACDDNNLIDGDGCSSTCAIEPPPASNMHIGDLDGAVSGNKRWTATVTATVHDNNTEGGLSGVLISGSWSDGASSSCTTNGSGQCSVSRGTKNASITFLVDNLSATGWTYVSADNHDIDGYLVDSSGSGIVVNQDGTIQPPEDPGADTTPPVITILGDNPVTHNVGEAYSDAGATAQDNVDGNLTSNITTGGLGFDVNVLGPHTITYDVTDSAGNSSHAERTVNVIDPSSMPVVHVGDLESSSVATKGRWTANVSIAVHDASEMPVEIATITGTWTGGASSSCVTNSSGVCTVSRKTKDASIDFSVIDVVVAGATYSSADNHDAGGIITDGTTITVNQP